MKKISKIQNKKFVNKMQKELKNLGAVPFISDEMQFDLKTKKHGDLWLRIDKDSVFVFSLYGRFVSTEDLPELDNVNTWSGKFNHHSSGPVENVVNKIIFNIKSILN